eukprot:TRINITY_DN2856_c0_g1_i2.p1 TRINITY_DN2856_c0_g1~~TRINITY_DN2856_c0_g1_i2.p1  ORF type:complete len:107 (-),score=3.20 TRINITY_DN2856_c0_g1_i2:113-433(-)
MGDHSRGGNFKITLWNPEDPNLSQLATKRKLLQHTKYQHNNHEYVALALALCLFFYLIYPHLDMKTWAVILAISALVYHGRYIIMGTLYETALFIQDKKREIKQTF